MTQAIASSGQSGSKTKRVVLSISILGAGATWWLASGWLSHQVGIDHVTATCAPLLAMVFVTYSVPVLLRLVRPATARSIPATEVTLLARPGLLRLILDVALFSQLLVALTARQPPSVSEGYNDIFFVLIVLSNDLAKSWPWSQGWFRVGFKIPIIIGLGVMLYGCYRPDAVSWILAPAIIAAVLVAEAIQFSTSLRRAAT